MRGDILAFLVACAVGVSAQFAAPVASAEDKPDDAARRFVEQVNDASMSFFSSGSDQDAREKCRQLLSWAFDVPAMGEYVLGKAWARASEEDRKEFLAAFEDEIVGEFFKVDELTFQTTWFVVSLLTELAVLLVLRTRGPLRGSRPSRLLILATLATALLAVALPYAGPLSRIFGFVPLPLAIVIAAILIVAAYVTTTEALKLYFYRSERASAHGHRRRAPGKAA